MLAVARSVAPPEAGIEWHQASADAMPLPDDAYDVVLCQMGLQFFPDKPSALREMRRVLAPGGRLVTKLPGPTPPAFQLFADALARHVAPEVAGFAQGVFSLHDPEEIGALLDEAGFRDVSVEVGRRTLRLPPPADFLWQYVHSTPMAEPVGRLDQERRTAFERDVVSGWEPFTEDGTLVVEVDVATATGWN